MKAVILEIIKEKAVVMKENGTVRRVRNKNYSVGDEIYMKEGILSHRKWAPIVAALLIFAMVGTGTWAYATPAYEISLVDEDENNILIRVNKLDKVLGIKINGEEYLLDEEIDSRNLEDVINALIKQYDVKNESEYILMTTIAKDKEKAEEIAKKVKDRIEKNKEERKVQNDNNIDDDENDRIEIRGLGSEEVVRAKELGLTPGHYNIITNLMGVEDTNYDPERIKRSDEEFYNYVNMSKQDLMEEFSARDGEKNNPSVNAPGQEDKEDKEKKEKDTPPGQLKEKTVVEVEELDNDLEDDDDDDDDDDESGRPESPGKSNEAPGQSNSKNR